MLQHGHFWVFLLQNGHFVQKMWQTVHKMPRERASSVLMNRWLADVEINKACRPDPKQTHTYPAQTRAQQLKMKYRALSIIKYLTRPDFLWNRGSCLSFSHRFLICKSNFPFFSFLPVTYMHYTYLCIKTARENSKPNPSPPPCMYVCMYRHLAN